MQETEEKPRDFLPRGLAEPRLGADERGALIPLTDVHLPFRASPASPQPAAPAAGTPACRRVSVDTENREETEEGDLR